MAHFGFWSDLVTTPLGVLCPAYTASWLTWAHLLSELFPYFVSSAFFIYGLVAQELLFFWFGLWSGLDWGVNLALQALIRQPSATPGCGATYEMPSYTAQHITFVIASYFLTVQIYKFRGKFSNVFVLLGLMFFVLYSRILFAKNTSLQLLIGGLIGFLNSLLFHASVRWVLIPIAPWVVNSRVTSFLNLTDTLLVPKGERARLSRVQKKERRRFYRELRKKQKPIE